MITEYKKSEKDAPKKENAEFSNGAKNLIREHTETAHELGRKNNRLRFKELHLSIEIKGASLIYIVAKMSILDYKEEECNECKI